MASMDPNDQNNQTISNIAHLGPISPQIDTITQHSIISQVPNNSANSNQQNYFLQNFIPDEDLDYLLESLNNQLDEENDLLESEGANSSNHQDTSTVNSNELFLNESSQVEQNNNNKSHSNSPNNGIGRSPLGKKNSNISRFKDSNFINLNKTMPLLPYCSFDRFKHSDTYKYLETCYYYINKLNGYKVQGKFDLENDEANELCRDLFEQIEFLQKNLKIVISNRNYRRKFSQAYISLYEEDSFGYLTEILDSAQEATPYLVVNGEKFIFTKEVIDHGNQLYSCFCGLINLITDIMNIMYEEVAFENITQVKKDLKIMLIDFDKKWALYEEKYISELINIERISRRYIFEGIKLEKDLTLYEKKANLKGRLNILKDREYNELRDKFVKIITELNKIANINGKGRDDLSIDILYKSENVLCTISDIKSKGMRKLAKSVKNSLAEFRELFRKYNTNIEGVDPQLVNNPDLVNALYNFETTWEKAKKYFSDKNRYNDLLIFNQIVEVISEKYSHDQIKNLIEQSDPAIFVTIPAVLILRAIDNGDINIIKQYIPNIDNKNEENGSLYNKLSNVVQKVYSEIGDSYYGYNLFEKMVLFDDTVDEDRVDKEILKYMTKETMTEFKKDIKILSMNMQRYKPREWNEFFQLAMEIE